MIEYRIIRYSLQTNDEEFGFSKEIQSDVQAGAAEMEVDALCRRDSFYNYQAS